MSECTFHPKINKLKNGSLLKNRNFKEKLSKKFTNVPSLEINIC